MTLPSGAPEVPTYQGLSAQAVSAVAPTGLPTQEEPRRLFRVEEFAQLVGIGRTKAFALVMSGEVESVLIGTARRVPREAVDEFIQRLRAQARAAEARSA